MILIILRLVGFIIAGALPPFLLLIKSLTVTLAAGFPFQIPIAESSAIEAFIYVLIATALIYLVEAWYLSHSP